MAHFFYRRRDHLMSVLFWIMGEVETICRDHHFITYSIRIYFVRVRERCGFMRYAWAEFSWWTSGKCRAWSSPSSLVSRRPAAEKKIRGNGQRETLPLLSERSAYGIDWKLPFVESVWLKKLTAIRIEIFWFTKCSVFSSFLHTC